MLGQREPSSHHIKVLMTWEPGNLGSCHHRNQSGFSHNHEQRSGYASVSPSSYHDHIPPRKYEESHDGIDSSVEFTNIYVTLQNVLKQRHITEYISGIFSENLAKTLLELIPVIFSQSFSHKIFSVEACWSLFWFVLKKKTCAQRMAKLQQKPGPVFTGEDHYMPVLMGHDKPQTQQILKYSEYTSWRRAEAGQGRPTHSLSRKVANSNTSYSNHEKTEALQGRGMPLGTLQATETDNSSGITSWWKQLQS